MRTHTHRNNKKYMAPQKEKMTPDQTFLLSALIVSQAALWTAYAFQLKTGKPKPYYWGKIQNTKYYLGMAAAAYVVHLIVGGYMAAHHEHAESWHRWMFGTGVLLYYGAQMFFIPWLVRANRTDNKQWVRGLLWCCVLPMLATTIAASDFGRKSKKYWLIVLSVFALLHVVVNDAALFGSRF